MANRRANKKLRAETRARMVATGESYQLALQRLLRRPEVGRRTSPLPTTLDLIPIALFGTPATLVTFEGPTVQSFTILGRAPSSHSPGLTFWLPVMRFLRPQGRD
jgi:hypothetical protein